MLIQDSKVEQLSRARLILPPSSSSAGNEGLEKLVQVLALGRTSPSLMREATTCAELIPEAQLTGLLDLANRYLRQHVKVPEVQNNLLHIVNDHLRPFNSDQRELIQRFGIRPLLLRVLMVLHDLGKVEVPSSLDETLVEIFRWDFLSREILMHEYASIQIVDTLAEQVGLEPKFRHALQLLIANHNFGPDLCDPRNKTLRDHWWPKNFREKIIPALAQYGISVEAYFNRDERGVLQYNHAENSPYSVLLTIYDRGIASAYNGFGVGTWQKYAQEDYNGIRFGNQLEKGGKPALRARTLVQNMDRAADWAETEIESLWRTMQERYDRSGKPMSECVAYHRQVESLHFLKGIILKVRNENVITRAGRAEYTTHAGDRYRVVDSTERGLAAAKLYRWEQTNGGWKLVSEDASPITLFFRLVQKDVTSSPANESLAVAA